MVMNNPYKTYEQNTVNTASPGELTVMLYNGCLKFISKAKQAIEEMKYEDRNLNIQKAQNIIRELMVTLNMDIDVSKNMIILYEYIFDRLTEANIHNDMRALDEATVLVTDFRDTWKQVIQMNRKQQHQGGIV
ncbi:flagellar export chaperone FliS [Bacillus massiliigorillae]|uniref:flagellar export chaperone FliS n=1 Tax=Bacillus massiliigorillae TaxID=1243664 RepID=UPI0003A7AF5B|nr:flagellar export chaperone FliS [Bacillus massiliigorillae]